MMNVVLIQKRDEDVYIKQRAHQLDVLRIANPVNVFICDDAPARSQRW
jgi:hypothetical protein